VQAVQIAQRIRALGDRFLAISEVSQILGNVGRETAKRRVLDAQAVAADAELKCILKKGARAAEMLEAIERLERVATGCEELLIEIDATVSTTLFRNVLESSRVGTVRLLQYARLIARYFRADVHHTERLDVLTQRLLTQPRVDTVRELRPRAGTDAALTYIAGGAKAPEAIRKSALEFFQKAAVRVASIEAVDGLFTGGFYLDVLGYKVSIRESMLDAEILRASAELNAALANRLVTLMQNEGVSPKEIAERMAAVETQVAEIFDSAEMDEAANEPSNAASKPPATPQKTAPAPTRAAPVVLLKPQHGARLLASLLVAVVLALGIGAFRRSSGNANELIPLDEAAVAALSPVLESAARSRGQASPLLIGEVAPAKWLLMDAAERQSSAALLAKELQKQNIEDALLYQGPSIVVQVNGGRVLFAQ
jgi:hypothetical protein